MFDVILVSHGPLASAMLASAQLLCGKQERVKTFGLFEGDSVDAFGDQVAAAIDEGLSRGEVVVLTDLMLGSPFNVTCLAMNGRDFWHVTGMSLPVVVQMLMDRHSMDAADAVASAMEVGSRALVNVNELLSGDPDDE